MFIVSLLSWWYGAGWKLRVVAVRERLLATIDYFSIDLLARTLFAPFRQISAGKVTGPIAVQLRAFFDQLLSRVIGAIVRSMMICVGLVAIILHLVFGLLAVITWAIVPLFPLFGAVAMMMGWMPWIR